MRGIDAHVLDDLSSYPLHRAAQAFSQSRWQDTRGDGYAGEIRHLVGANRELFATVLSRARPQHEVERVFGINRQSANLCTRDLQRPGYTARLAAIAVQTQRPYFGSRELDGIPFQHDGCLGGVAATKDGWGGGGLAVGAVDGGLEG